VLDFPDASWLIPLHRSERRLFVVRRGKKYYVPMRATQDSCRVPLTWSRCVTLSLPKADFRTRVTWTSSVFQIKQGTADRVTKITTEFRRLNAVPIRDLRSDEGKYTAVANCIVTRGRFLSRYGQPWPWSPRFPELLEWVYAYRISEGDLFREVYLSKALFGYGK